MLIWSATAVFGLAAFCWWAIVIRVLLTRGTWKLVADDLRCDPSILVSVVIPARDEVDNIAASVAGVLGSDHPNIELLVLDDGSTDGTSDVLASVKDDRLVVLTGGDAPLPEGWLGKPWACHRASEHATGEWLLFIDADVCLAPEAISRAVRRAIDDEVGLLSGLGMLVYETLGELIIQPIVAMLILVGNQLGNVNDPEQPDSAMASGQFLLFRRDAYRQVGGHEAVAGQVVDDQSFARVMKREGLGLRLVFMHTLYSCRMYRNGREAWQGWRKNLFPGMDRRWGVLLPLVTTLFIIHVLPYIVFPLSLLAGAWPLAIASGLAIAGIQCLRLRMDWRFNKPLLAGQLTQPLCGPAIVGLLLDSAVSTSLGLVRWKGRAV